MLAAASSIGAADSPVYTWAIVALEFWVGSA